MASLNMAGPWKLTKSNVEAKVTETSPGNYGLGESNEKGGLTVEYVGRSDNDVRARLLAHAAAGQYADFKFSYAASAKEAFEKECRNYHDFNPSGNSIHPQRPKDKTWECPVCNVFDN